MSFEIQEDYTTRTVPKHQHRPLKFSLLHYSSEAPSCRNFILHRHRILKAKMFLSL